MRTSTAARLARPVDDLLLAFRGTSYFLRAVSVLSDDDFDQPAGVPGSTSRRAIMATVAYDARGFARFAEEVRAGVTPARTFDSGELRDETIASGAALPARALRHLIDHSAVHLRVEWRDLNDEQWSAQGLDHNSAVLKVVDTPLARARQVWLGALELGSVGRLEDVPAEVTDRVGSSASHGH